MAIYKEQPMPCTDLPKPVVCHQCGNDDFPDSDVIVGLTTAVWWGFPNGPTIILCPPCAEHVGTQLIGDAARACVSLGSVSAMRNRRNRAVPDPSLVTKRLQQDEDVTL